MRTSSAMPVGRPASAGDAVSQPHSRRRVDAADADDRRRPNARRPQSCWASTHLGARGAAGDRRAGIGVLVFAALRGRAMPSALRLRRTRDGQRCQPAPAADSSMRRRRRRCRHQRPSRRAAAPARPHGTSATRSLARSRPPLPPHQPTTPAKRRGDCGAGPAGTKPAGRGTSTGVITGTDRLGGRRYDRRRRLRCHQPPPPGAAMAPARPSAPSPSTRFACSSRKATSARARRRAAAWRRPGVDVPPGGGAPIVSLANGRCDGNLLRALEAAEVARRQRSGSREQDRSRPMGFLRGDRNWVILLTQRRARHPPDRGFSAEDRAAGARGAHRTSTTLKC